MQIPSIQNLLPRVPTPVLFQCCYPSNKKEDFHYTNKLIVEIARTAFNFGLTCKAASQVFEDRSFWQHFANTIQPNIGMFGGDWKTYIKERCSFASNNPLIKQDGLLINYKVFRKLFPKNNYDIDEHFTYFAEFAFRIMHDESISMEKFLDKFMPVLVPPSKRSVNGVSVDYSNKFVAVSHGYSEVHIYSRDLKLLQNVKFIDQTCVNQLKISGDHLLIIGGKDAFKAQKLTIVNLEMRDQQSLNQEPQTISVTSTDFEKMHLWGPLFFSDTHVVGQARDLTNGDHICLFAANLNDLKNQSSVHPSDFFSIGSVEEGLPNTMKTQIEGNCYKISSFDWKYSCYSITSIEILNNKECPSSTINIPISFKKLNVQDHFYLNDRFFLACKREVPANFSSINRENESEIYGSERPQELMYQDCFQIITFDLGESEPKIIFQEIRSKYYDLKSFVLPNCIGFLNIGDHIKSPEVIFTSIHYMAKQHSPSS